MNQTDFWRTEVWHPLSVHFPIVFLLSATFVNLTAVFINQNKGIAWRRAGDVLLYCGCITVWISIYTGNMADPIVARKICDPTILKTHELAAYNVAYLFSAAAIIAACKMYFKTNPKMIVLKYLIAVLMLAGTGFLLYTGHLGASLVYQQGAGVNQPDADCNSK